MGVCQAICAILFSWSLIASGTAEATEDGETSDVLSIARSAKYSWMLPKTQISLSVVYTLTGCSDAAGFEISPTVTLTNVSVPDTDLGPDYPDGIIFVPPEDMISFWQDKTISVKTNTSTRILSYLGSTSTNQAGAILGTAITSTAKLTAAVFGTPAVGAAAPALCGRAVETLAKIKTYKDKLTDPTLTAAELKDIPALIQSLQADLSITVERKFDPGTKPIRVDMKTGRAYVGGLAPSAKQLVSAHWVLTPEQAQEVAKSDQLFTAVYFNLNDSYPAQAIRDALTCNDDGKCYLAKVSAPRHTLFREVAYVPVVVTQGHLGKIVTTKTLPFGQFGIPRKLPLNANLFEQITWSVTFADTGEMTDSQFTSKATGLALVSLFAAAASTTNAIATESRTAASALDSSAARLQNENAALKAQIDNINLTQQLQSLLATKR